MLFEGESFTHLSLTNTVAVLAFTLVIPIRIIIILSRRQRFTGGVAILPIVLEQGVNNLLTFFLVQVIRERVNR